jgi:small-conductance mechanosensitive channel
MNVLDVFDPGFSVNGYKVDVGEILATILAVFAILVAGWLLVRLARVFVHGAVRTLLERTAELEGTASELSALEIKKRSDTIEGLFVNVVRFFVFMIAGLMILERAFQIDIGPAIAGLGVAGIAVGLGTQSLVHDYLNGALILIENQYSVGDIVQIAGKGGVVEDFTLRRTTLRDLSGTVHIVPNGQVEVVSNLTRTWARVNEQVQVAYGTDMDMVKQVIDTVGQEMAADPVMGEQIIEPPHVERVNELGDRGVTLLVLGKVKPAAQWATSGELRRRLLTAFDENGIEMPTGFLLTWSGQELAGYGKQPPKARQTAGGRAKAKRA